MQKTMVIELKAGTDDAGRRLDRILRKALPEYSLSLIHRLLRQGGIKVDGKPAGPGHRVRPGAEIQLESQVEPEFGPRRVQNSGPPPPLPEILWRGSGIIVFNKPSGLATHGHNSLDTLVNAHLAGKLPPSLSFRPGPLHRLDRPTSGAIAFSETLEGARLFSRLLREHKLVKTYLAIVEGTMHGEEAWEDALIRDRNSRKTLVTKEQRKRKPHCSLQNPRDALTTVRALACDNAYTLLEVRIATGRTHQIRAQAAARGHPLAGDKKYGGHAIPGGFFLHAWKMEAGGCLEDFPQPLVAPLPGAFMSRIQGLGQVTNSTISETTLPLLKI